MVPSNTDGGSSHDDPRPLSAPRMARGVRHLPPIHRTDGSPLRGDRPLPCACAPGVRRLPSIHRIDGSPLRGDRRLTPTRLSEFPISL